MNDATSSDRAEISGTAVAERLVALAVERQSGTLVLERGAVRKELGFLDGWLVAATSTLDREAISERLAESGVLSPADAANVRRTMQERGCAEAAALAGLKLVEPRALLDAMRERLDAVAHEAMSWQGGTVSFDADATPPADAKPLRRATLDLVHRALTAHVAPDRLAAPLVDAASLYARVDEGVETQLREWIGDDAVALRVLRSLDGSQKFEATVGVAFGAPAALAALWVAERTGRLHFESAPANGASDADSTTDDDAAEAPPEIEIEVVGDGASTGATTSQTSGADGEAAKAPNAEGAKELSAEAEGIRKEILELHDLLGDCTHYTLLGLEDDAEPAAIKKAYFKAAKRFHPDKLARLGLEEIRERAAEVFAAIAEANDVLSDDERRRDYDERLAGGGSADIDVQRLAQAEAFYRKGEVLTKMGDFRAAAEMLASAVQLWPEEAAYQSAYGFALYKRNPPDLDTAQTALEIAVDLAPQDAQAHMWLGLVLRAKGDVNRSAECTARARKLDPSVS